MSTFRTATVTELLSERPGLQRVRLDVDGTSARAYNLVQLTGSVAPGDRVVANTTAVELGLGTGGWHVVHWNLDRSELVAPGPDHIMKLRYTSLQFDAGTSELVHAEELEGSPPGTAPAASTLASTLDSTLDGTPVVVCQLHSQMGVVAATIAALAPDARVAYVMTDGAALPIVLSDLVADLDARGLLHTTVTVGHAFGGDLEAVTLHSGLALAARVARADIVIVAMGPGVVGTGTRLGTTAIEAAATVDAVDALGGRAVLCVRASNGDARPRHLGVSHHTATAAELARTSPLVAHHPEAVAELAGVTLQRVRVPDVGAILEDAGLRITTMGRGLNEDPLFFETAGAAAAVAVQLLNEPSV